MKIPFVSRSPVDDEEPYDDPYGHDYGYGDEPGRDGSNQIGRSSTASGHYEHLGRQGDGRREAGILPATTDPTPIVTAEEFADEMERLHSEATAEQRTAWAYLGLIGGLFVFLVLFGYACSDQRAAVPSGGQTGDLAAGGEPSRLVFRVDGDLIAIEGTVPDEAARAQLLAIAQASYGAENVIDQLQVDSSTTLDGGTLRFVGSAVFGDGRPEGLKDTVSSDFGLENRGFEVGFVDELLAPVNAEVAVTGDRVALTGTLPDEQSIVDLVSIATEVWGDGNVESTGLVAGSTTWTEGRLRVTGSTAADQRIANFVVLVSERLGRLIEVDTSALSVADPAEQLATVQSAVDGLVAASPIQFAPDSAEIEPASDAVLAGIADALGSVPTVPVEVVGHTDDVGPEEDNLTLSEDRAEAVVARLVELGVDAGRLSSRGEGEAQPIASNDTDEGKAANRRIEFILAAPGTGG
jgi:OOP family OmpA-OmpF porin